jgi:hypothetical protein
MITHIVLMKLKDASPEVTKKIHDLLMALPAIIPQIKHYECGANVVPSDRAYDFGLVSKFDSLEDLEIYAKHPDHQEALKYIRSVIEAAVAVDYVS